MSYGFTGLIFSVFTKRLFKTVRVYFTGEYETDTMRTVSTGFKVKHKFKSRWLAELYAQRINKGQYHRYVNTPYDCGFKKGQ